jgi:hypothetical protein
MNITSDDEKTIKELNNQRQKTRFGHIIKTDKYQIGNMIKIIAISLAILAIPL